MMLWLRMAVIAAMPWCWASPYWQDVQAWPVVVTRVQKISVVWVEGNFRTYFIDVAQDGTRRVVDYEYDHVIKRLPTRDGNGDWSVDYCSGATRCWRVVSAPEYEEAFTDWARGGVIVGMPDPPPPDPLWLTRRILFRSLAMAMAGKNPPPSFPFWVP